MGDERNVELDERDVELDERDEELDERKDKLDDREYDMDEKEEEIQKKEKNFDEKFERDAVRRNELEKHEEYLNKIEASRERERQKLENDKRIFLKEKEN